MQAQRAAHRATIERENEQRERARQQYLAKQAERERARAKAKVAATRRSSLAVGFLAACFALAVAVAVGYGLRAGLSTPPGPPVATVADVTGWQLRWQRFMGRRWVRWVRTHVSGRHWKQLVCASEGFC